MNIREMLSQHQVLEPLASLPLGCNTHQIFPVQLHQPPRLLQGVHLDEDQMIPLMAPKVPRREAGVHLVGDQTSRLQAPSLEAEVPLDEDQMNQSQSHASTCQKIC